MWASLGNCTPALLTVLAGKRLRKLPRIGAWLDARTSPRFQRLSERFGAGFVLLITPVIGVWALSVTGVGLGMDRRQLMICSGISILLYAILVSVGVALGIEALPA